MADSDNSPPPADEPRNLAVRVINTLTEITKALKEWLDAVKALGLTVVAVVAVFGGLRIFGDDGEPTEPPPSSTTSSVPPESSTSSPTTSVIPPAGVDVDIVTEPADNPLEFELSFGGEVKRSLAATDDPLFVDLAPGDYTVAVEVPEKWRLSSIECDDAVDEDDAEATVKIGDGERMTCTFTLVEPATISIVNVTDPPSGPDVLFDYAGAVSGSLGHDEQMSEQLAAPDTYTETAAGRELWDLVDVKCDPQSTIDLDSGTATIQVSPGESVECTFTYESLEPMLVAYLESLPAIAEVNDIIEAALVLTEVDRPFDRTFEEAKKPGGPRILPLRDIDREAYVEAVQGPADLDPSPLDLATSLRKTLEGLSDDAGPLVAEHQAMLDDAQLVEEIARALISSIGSELKNVTDVKNMTDVSVLISYEVEPRSQRRTNIRELEGALHGLLARVRDLCLRVQDFELSCGPHLTPSNDPTTVYLLELKSVAEAAQRLNDNVIHLQDAWRQEVHRDADDSEANPRRNLLIKLWIEGQRRIGTRIERLRPPLSIQGLLMDEGFWEALGIEAKTLIDRVDGLPESGSVTTGPGVASAIREVAVKAVEISETFSAYGSSTTLQNLTNNVATIMGPARLGMVVTELCREQGAAATHLGDLCDES